jgi:hypothetical protein
MAGEIYRTLYRKLLALYPRAFRERFGESMEQTFNDMCSERKPAGGIYLTFLSTASGIVTEHLSAFTHRRNMADSAINSTKSAIIGVILSLPAATLFSLLVLNIEPPFGPLEPWLGRAEPDKPHILGSLIVLFLTLLLPVAFFINLRPVLLNRRAGHGVAASPVNLCIVVGVFAFLAWIIGSIIVDQYPCWIGVPNCD